MTLSKYNDIATGLNLHRGWQIVHFLQYMQNDGIIPLVISERNYEKRVN